MRTYKIACGNSRKDTKWKNQTVTWDALSDMLRTPRRTTETVNEYHHMPKEKRSSIKDVGGFVGGHLAGGRRTSNNVHSRSLITLDIDSDAKDALELIEMNAPYRSLVYSTHSHTESDPRYRLIIPMSRDVSPDEYVAVSRKVAEDIGIEMFDDTTYQPSRLMYWASTSSNGQYIFRSFDGDLLDPDAVLKRYDDWTDFSTHPHSSRESASTTKKVSKVADPLSKRGVIGAFNRTYTISQVINKYLSDIYTPVVEGVRYSYCGGTSFGGAVIYNDDTLLYSNHGTDPAGGYAVNAYDLVRIHKFYADSYDTEESISQMNELALNDPSVKLTLMNMRAEEVKLELTDEDIQSIMAGEDPTCEWRGNLQLDKNGKVKVTPGNLDLIFTCDRNLQFFRFNDMSELVDIVGKVPWSHSVNQQNWCDEDTAHLLGYLYQEYSMDGPKDKVVAAFDRASGRKRHNPERDWLDSLVWDGVERLDDCLTRHLNAEDTELTRACMRKWLVGAVARVYEPGIKFDSMLVLVGGQGVGKSEFFSKIGGEWFTPSVTIDSIGKSKDAYDIMARKTIICLDELSGMNKADQNKLKTFITATEDTIRLSYRKYAVTKKRCCVFCATTNEEEGFLRDLTGNRRYWIVRVPGYQKIDGSTDPRHPYYMQRDEIDQLWAEAKFRYLTGENLTLEGKLDEQIAAIQDEFIASDGRDDYVERFLEMPISEDWYDKDINERRVYTGHYLRGENVTPGTRQREWVSTLEVSCECFGRDLSDANLRSTQNDIKRNLKSIGWYRTDERRTLKGYGRVYVWKKRNR